MASALAFTVLHLTVIAVIGAVSAVIGLGCTIAYGIELYREWVKRRLALASYSKFNASRRHKHKKVPA